MTKKYPLLLLALLSIAIGALAAKLPVKEWNAGSATPLIIYISGDGGMNDFSTGLCESLHRAGYSVTALNAKSYFWEKKTPAQTAADINAYVQANLAGRRNQRWLLVGYSFGADVSPFIINKLPDSTKNKLGAVVLLSPSTTTDFEIHWSDMLGFGKKRKMDVVAEINKLGAVKTATLFGDDEKDFPLARITLKNYSNTYLPGGHHFDGNTAEISKTIAYFIR